MGKSKKKKKHNPTHKKVQNQYNQDETFADNDELFGKSKIHSVTTLQIIQWFHGDGHERTDKSSLKSKERQYTYIHTYIHNLFGKEGFKKRSRGLMWTYYLK